MHDLDHNLYHDLAQVMFQPGFPGYHPELVESPNGDGKWDEGKLYAHLNVKVLGQMIDTQNRIWLEETFMNLHLDSLLMAKSLDIPPQLWPSASTSTLRILRYPPNVGSHCHTDFDLFTMNLYRNVKGLVRIGADAPPGIHYGEILSLVHPNKIATPHEVLPYDEVQESIVFFAMPRFDAVLPNGQTVGDWVTERRARSRK